MPDNCPRGIELGWGERESERVWRKGRGIGRREETEGESLKFEA